jgi:hypothetical protein
MQEIDTDYLFDDIQFDEIYKHDFSEDFQILLEDIPIKEIEKFLRKKKLESIKNGKI